MRSHAEIVKDAAETTEQLHALAAEHDVSIHTVRSWIQRDSIPPEHWRGFVEAERATFDELLTARERKAAA